MGKEGLVDHPDATYSPEVDNIALREAMKPEVEALVKGAEGNRIRAIMKVRVYLQGHCSGEIGRLPEPKPREPGGFRAVVHPAPNEFVVAEKIVKLLL